MAAANVKLSTGAVQSILNGSSYEKPVLQILGIKRLATGDRYRLFLSDGASVSSFAMLATQLNHHFDTGNVDKFSVIRINEYICNQTQLQEKTRRIIIILDFSLLANGAIIGDKIGSPVPIDTASNAAPSSNSVSVNSVSSSVEVKRPPPTERFNSYSKPLQETRRDSLPAISKVVQPISCVTPYQNRWTIKARVSSKSTIRTFTNARGEGKLFSVEVLDDSGEIRATAFGEQVDKYYDMLELNKVYYISQGFIKPANKAFNKTKNDYEMTFNKDTVVEPCCDSTSDIPMLQFNFVPISELNGKEANSFVDVIGICKQASDLQTIVAKTSNREMIKRTVNLVDQSNAEVAVTLWSKEAEDFDGSCNPVVAIKGAKISDFGGCSLNVYHSSTILIDPDIPESNKLRTWYHNDGHKADYTSISRSGGSGVFSTNWKYLGDIKSEELGLKEKNDYITTKLFIGFIKHENAMYKACAEDQCKKKVIPTPEGLYRCEKCNKESPKYKWNLFLQVVGADFTDSTYITCFQEAGEKLLGKTAEEISAIAEENGGNISSLTNAVVGKQFVFRIRVSSEYYSDEQRVRVTTMEVSPVNFIDYSKRLVAEIKQLM